MHRDLDAALAALRARATLRPEVALVLGSGLGALADDVQDAVSLAFEDIPGYPRGTVAGHAGRLVLGRLEGRPILMSQGRPHVYEGHSTAGVTFPIRLAYALGARRLLLTNAAGGINPDFGSGTLMLVTDHLNLAHGTPVTVTGPDGATTRAPRGSPYDPRWVAEAERIAEARGIKCRKGVYAWTTGPSYETPAEIRYFRFAGADAVGMSTVPEATQAAALGMPVLCISAITNPAAGMSPAPLDHAEVLAVGRTVRSHLAGWIHGIIAALPT